MMPFSAPVRTNFGREGGSSGDGDAAVLGDVGLARSGDAAAIESLVLFRLLVKSMTGVGRAWNVVRASESSPSCASSPGPRISIHIQVRWRVG